MSFLKVDNLNEIVVDFIVNRAASIQNLSDLEALSQELLDVEFTAIEWIGLLDGSVRLNNRLEAEIEKRRNKDETI